MLNLHEMVVLSVVFSFPHPTKAYVAQVAAKQLEGDPRFDTRVALATIDGLKVAKLLTVSSDGRVRDTREALTVYRDARAQLQRTLSHIRDY